MRPLSSRLLLLAAVLRLTAGAADSTRTLHSAAGVRAAAFDSTTQRRVDSTKSIPRRGARKAPVAPRYGPLREDGDDVFLDRIQPLDWGGVPLLFGTPTFVIRHDSARVNGLGLLFYARDSVQVLLAPQGSGYMHMVQGAVEQARPGHPRMLHAMWTAEHLDSTATVDTLWYAAWDGRQWTVPERAWVGPELEWGAGYSSDVLVTPAGVTIIAPWREPHEQRSGGSVPGLLRLDRRGGTWRARHIALPTTPVEALAYVTPRGDVSVALFSAMELPSDPPLSLEARRSGARIDRSSVFTARLDADGTVLHELRRLYSGLKVQTSMVRLSVPNHGPAALVWLAVADGPTARTWLFASRADAPNGNWTAPHGVTLPGRAMALQSIASSDRVFATFKVRFDTAAAPSPPNDRRAERVAEFRACMAVGQIDTDSARLAVGEFGTAGWRVSALSAEPIMGGTPLFVGRDSIALLYSLRHGGDRSPPFSCIIAQDLFEKTPLIAR